jgi:hypothetical protein
MSYKCLACGHIFDEGEEARWTENVGEYWGTPAMERMTGCPLCRGDYERTTPCEICGSEHLDDELVGGVCDECLEDCRYDINICYEIGKSETESIDLNSFIVSLFDREEIEEILLKALLQEEEIHGKVDCQKFIDIDKSWFAERLAEEVRKNEQAKV